MPEFTKDKDKPLPSFKGELSINFPNGVTGNAQSISFTPQETIASGEKIAYPFPAWVVNKNGSVTLDDLINNFGSGFVKDLFIDALREHCIRKWRQYSETQNPAENFTKGFFERTSRGTLTSVKLQQLSQLKLIEATQAKREKRLDDFKRLMGEYQSITKQQQALMMDEMRRGIVVKAEDEDEE